ncbi:hypothetical protein [Pseudomonas mandelii]|uniref:hypothetical protein n=1 Tax=Pseudomonas mandelii TaxID=75612 RepID=UPI0021CC66D7|nr:hypothetical protein [Pseudomonas mandelii]
MLLIAPLQATSEPEELGVQDLVIFAVKSPALPTAIESAQALIWARDLNYSSDQWSAVVVFPEV